ncbi:MAG: pimeloyl-ACP methyl ester esterase BioH [Chromatiales bacterium]|jgi:pimeloyl-[acyl-carrier protein] methyl ester esterase
MSLATLTYGQGSPLVLLHGWGMNAGVWMPLVPRLVEGWQVILAELPGHGESTPLDGDIDDWAGALLDVVPHGAVWLGWSLGAMTTLAAATLAPERVRALILAGGTPRFTRTAGWECGMRPDLLQGFAGELFASPERTMLRFLGLQVRGADNERETLKQLKSAVSQRPQTGVPALRTGLDLLLKTDLRDRLPDLRVPSLWLYGDRDTLVSSATAHHVRRLQPEARAQVIAGAGHAPFLSHPAQCLQALEALA